MKQIVITRNQYELLKDVFDLYNPDRVLWTEQSTNGIGPSVVLEFDPKATVKLDITDVESW